MTYGEKAVGLTFNPSSDPMVDELKSGFAKLIDRMDAIRNDPDSSGEKKRLASIAITEMQTAQMWAVKAWTWKD